MNIMTAEETQEFKKLSEKLLKSHDTIVNAYVEVTSQKQPEFSPGAYLIDLLHRCQNGHATCLYTATEIENYIEKEISSYRKDIDYIIDLLDGQAPLPNWREGNWSEVIRKFGEHLEAHQDKDNEYHNLLDSSDNLSRENKELKKIIHQAYLYVLDHWYESCGGTKHHLSCAEEVQLGRDLATHGIQSELPTERIT